MKMTRMITTTIASKMPIIGSPHKLEWMVGCANALMGAGGRCTASCCGRCPFARTECTSHRNDSAQRSLLHDLCDVWREEQCTSWHEPSHRQAPRERKVDGPRVNAPDKASPKPVPKFKPPRFNTIAAMCS